MPRSSAAGCTRGTSPRSAIPATKCEIGYDVVDNEHFTRMRAIVHGSCRRFQKARYLFANTRFLRTKGHRCVCCAPTPAIATFRHTARQIATLASRDQRKWRDGERRGRTGRSLRVADTVHWPGFLQDQDLPAVYRSAGVFVHPARHEPWGLVVNEAAAAGLPLIVGRRVGAACELVREGENGFLVDPDDTESVAATSSSRVTG